MSEVLTACCVCEGCTINLPLNHVPHLYHCFCDTCKRQSGALCQSFYTYPSFSLHPVEVKGKVSSYESSPGTERFFCTTCGASMGCTVKGTNVFYVNAGVLSPPPQSVKSERAIFCPTTTPASHSLLAALPTVIECHADYGRVDEIDYDPTATQPSVLFHGVSCVDKITYVRRFERDKKVAATKVATLPGGNAGNAAVACKDLLRDFASVKVVSKVAVGPEGELLERELLGRGVDVDYIVRSEAGRTLEVCVIVEEEKNSRTCLSLPRGDMVPDLTLEEVAKVRGDWAVFDGRHLESALELASRVKEDGGKVVVEAELRSRSGEIRAEMEHLMGLADYVVMAEDFLERFYEGATLEEKLKNWRDCVCGGEKRWCIVTRGSLGCLMYYSVVTALRPFSLSPSQVVDSTGAGDCFLGALTAFLVKGASVEQSVQAASWAGMMQCRGAGGRHPIDWKLAKGNLDWL